MKDSLLTKSSLLILSAFAAAAYICQYAIIKAASSQRALIWIGCQGVLAAFRLGYWIFNPSFDDPPVSAWEYAELDVAKSETTTLSELICDTIAGKTWQMPTWAFGYLMNTPLQQVLHIARSRRDIDVIPGNAEICALVYLDLMDLLRKRNGFVESYMISNKVRLALYREKREVGADLVVFPFLMTGVPYREYDSTLADAICWIEAVDRLGTRDSDIARDPEVINAAWCDTVSVTEDGKPLHLTYNSELPCEEHCKQKGIHKAHGDLKSLEKRSELWKKLMSHFYRPSSLNNKGKPAVAVKGEAQRYKQVDRPSGADYETGISKVRDYIELRLKASQEDYLWARIQSWLSKKMRGVRADTKTSTGGQQKEPV